jgi:hypothetical protein
VGYQPARLIHILAGLHTTMSVAAAGSVLEHLKAFRYYLCFPFAEGDGHLEELLGLQSARKIKLG